MNKRAINQIRYTRRFKLLQNETTTTSCRLLDESNWEILKTDPELAMDEMLSF